MPHTYRYSYKESINDWNYNACCTLTSQPVWYLDFKELHFLCIHYTSTLTIYLDLTILDCLVIKITSDTQFVLVRKDQVLFKKCMLVMHDQFFIILF